MQAKDGPPLFSFEDAWGVAITFMLLVLGWLRLTEREEIKAMKAEIEKANDRAKAAEDALDAHKLFAAEHFARTAEMKAGFAEMEARLIREIDQRSAREIALLEEIKARLNRAN